MKERFEEIKEVLEELSDKGIDLLELNIWNEIDCQLDKELNDNQLMTLYCTVERAYLKTSYATIEQLVRYCLKNINKIYDMSIYDIIENCIEE